MASDSTDARRRKHHRHPSDDEAEEPSKRRKHRHHHRSKHRHHHRSKKHDDKQIKEEIENSHERICNNNVDDIDGEVGEVGDAEVAVNVGTVGVVMGGSLGLDYEMEEGEIVEEGDGEGFVKAKGRDGDVELSINDSSMGVHESGVERNGKNRKHSDDEYVNRKERKKDGSRIHDEVQFAKQSSVEHFAKDVSVENGLPVERSGKITSHYNYESGVNDKSSENAGTRQKAVTRSPSRDKHKKRGHSRSHSKSPNRSRGRSRSQSILKDHSIVGTPRRQDDEYYSEREHRSGSGDGRMFSRDSLRDRERECSSSLYSGRVDRHHSRETRDRDRAGIRETHERNRAGSRETRDRDRAGSREIRERDRAGSREIRERDRAGSREIERERVREKEREREREKERERLREREMDRERDRDREREKEKDRERDRERERDRDWERRSQRDRASSRGRSRDRDSDKSSRLRKYYDDERDRYDDSRHKRYDEADVRERIKGGDREKVESPEHNPSEDSLKLRRDDDDQGDYEERIGLQLAEQEEEDIDKIKEESRRRRQAILEKYKSRQSQNQLQAHQEDRAKDQAEPSSQPSTAVNGVPEIPNGQIEGADVYVAEPSFPIGKSPPRNGLTVQERASGTGGLGEGTPKSERSPDMFCDDIFGESPTGVRKTGKGDGIAIEKSGLHDNWDDAEGYYSYRFGEVLDGRYEIVAAHGKGVFSTVVRAKDLKAKPGDPEEVAIKMIRNNETMYKAGMTELVILKKLVGADPEDRRHCVRFISSFKYRNHLCLVFESLHMNLREVLKKFGRNIGLKLTAVRAYAKQLFIALKHLKNCGVLHSDIKPDNMLVNEAKNVLKLCDFGNAMFAGKNEITPYLVSRFYRAPEIILGLPYDHPLDMWSVGCCLFELYTGKVLFPGSTNNDMLRLHMELKGPFPKKMIRKGGFTDQHFDQDLNFLATEEDPVTKRAIKRLLLNIKPKDFGILISGSPGEEPKMLANFKDLLEKIFVLDPDKRLTVSQALSHPFITGK